MEKIFEYVGWVLLIGSPTILVVGLLNKPAAFRSSSREKEVLKLLREMLYDQYHVARSTRIAMSTHFRENLKLDLTEEWIVVCDLEDHFGIDEIGEAQIERLQTVGDAVRFVVAQLQAEPTP